MGRQTPKPPAFVAGAKSLSARALNLLRQAIPSILRGGAGIDITPFGDRFVISLKDPQGERPGSVNLMVLVEEFDEYLHCNRDGVSNQPVYVAKPWGLRKGADWPAGAPTPTYTYDPVVKGRRVADFGSYTIQQDVTPPYQVGEEILAIRLPSLRIDRTALVPVPDTEVIWIDANMGGRCWSLWGDHVHAGVVSAFLSRQRTKMANDSAPRDDDPLGSHHNSSDSLWYSNRAKWL